MGRMDVAAMADWLTREGFSVVIDAAHPYAEQLHQTVVEAAALSHLEVIRYDRPSQQQQGLTHPLLHTVDNLDSACVKVNSLDVQRVLLTTGSKNIADFCAHLVNHKVFARVLPNDAALSACTLAGLALDEIVALKGPFSVDFNQALYRELAIDVVVTKESGSAGGFQEKVSSCLEQGIHCVVIRRPGLDKTAYAAVIYQCEDLSPLLSTYF